MKNKINLNIKDYRDSFHEPNKKKPYFLTVNSNGERFYFSNKKKAERWLSKFSSESAELYKELGAYLSKLYELNISCVDVISFVSYQNKRVDIDWYAERYWRVLNGYTGGLSVEIGSEIGSLLRFIQNQQEFYRKLIRTHNRYNLKYQALRMEIKQLKRLQIDYDMLISNADGMHKVTSSDIGSVKSEFELSIA
ncbi:hypothetical protein [Tenacibaculum ovolyticum]|uniref:hypothetical protein n=1 Tax=Tenacibaculum ovolyticum TaxID=104270 RepID=UPI003BACF793